MEAVENKVVSLHRERRIKSPTTIQKLKKPYCERCGKPATGEPHHLRYRSHGGSDIPENLIQLCFDCHRAVHDGKIPRDELLKIVAEREGRKIEEIAKIIGITTLETENKITASPVGGQLAQYSLEDLLQLYVNITEEVDNTHWERGAILVVLIDGMGQKPSWIASKVATSAAQIRELAKTFRAFPEESSRAKDLSWFHHRLAANTDNPQKWIQLAAEKQWSTRQMREQIKSALSPESKKDQGMAKAEKAVRFTEEVLEEGGEAANWLKLKLNGLLKGQRGDWDAADIAASV